jgi:hypothetical protein
MNLNIESAKFVAGRKIAGIYNNCLYWRPGIIPSLNQLAGSP